MSQRFEDHDDLHAKWNEMFGQLKEYKEEHGDCNVPLDFTNSKLANWVNFVRWCHRRYEIGKKIPGGLTQDKIYLLEGIGFEWSNCNNASLRSVRNLSVRSSNRR
mmetsp:Transcript_15969/g.20269  ORF Transcript_15969/g.20269 Transcript_15969/m.20269 type:complete len:105 (-) Transcript_15969:273-587(-)